MGLIGAFLAGAGGRGLQQVSQNMTRRDELEQARQEREAERDEQRRAHEEMVRLQNRARYGYEGDEPDIPGMRASGGNSRSRGGRVTASAPDIADLARQLTARKEGMTDPEMAELEGAMASGQNPYTQEVDKDPGRMGPPAAGDMVAKPDDAKFRKRIAAHRQSLAQAMTASGNAEQVAKADQVYRDEERLDGATKDPGKLGLVSGLLAAREGKGQFAIQGNTRLNVHTGDTQTTEVGRAEVVRDRAAAGASSASAGKTNAERQAIVDHGGQLPADRTAQVRATEDAAQRLAQDLRKAEDRVEAARKRRAKPDEIAALESGAAAARQRYEQADQQAEALRQPRGQAPAPSPAAAPKPAAQAGRMSPQQVEALRTQAKAALGKKDPAAVRRRFEELTGQKADF